MIVPDKDARCNQTSLRREVESVGQRFIQTLPIRGIKVDLLDIQAGVFLRKVFEKDVGSVAFWTSLLRKINEVDRKAFWRRFGRGWDFKGGRGGAPFGLNLQEERIQFLHDLQLSREHLICNEDDRKFAGRAAELFLQFAQRLIIDWIARIEGFNFKVGDHRLQRREIILKNDLTGLAVLGIEEVDLDGRSSLGYSINGE